MDVWLPDDPTERFVGKPDWIGCNRLFCTSCRSWVRHLDGVSFAAGEPAGVDRERLYFDARAARDRSFRPSLNFRVYLCRCECVEIAGVKAAGELDKVESWECAGHPRKPVDEPVTPPPPGSEAEVEAALRASAAGPPSGGDLQPWDFVLRWRPPFVFRVVWPVVTRLLVDPDPVVRTRALELVGAWRAGDWATIDRLLALATQHASLFQEPGLRTLLATTLAGKALSIRSHRARIAKAIVSLLGGAPPPGGAASLVTEYEPEAVIRSAGRWTDRREDQGAAVDAAGSMAMYRRDHLLALLGALAARTAADREAILEEVTRNVGMPDDKLRLILEGDDIPFPHTRPTLDDCRRALGLASP
ncbi:MAG TPA: hypothetical protein VFT22_18690 [Kofleriaceae bacterium]|nr:hypothetical protein [Kofleriaceae bacterium]